MNIFKKSLAFVSTAAILGATFAPGVAAQGTDIANNGALSTNTVTQSDSQTNTTVQDNTATINNAVNVTSNTGGNTADYNTGGNVGIGTGNSVTGVQINNMANLNQATTSPVSNINPELPAAIQGNGAASANTFSSTNTQDNSVYQTNSAAFNNAVTVDSNTGNNTADFGTNGNTTILTGHSQTGVGIQNTANGNFAGYNTMPAVSSSIVNPLTGTDILSNGALSANTVDLSNNAASLLEQTNSSNITNAVSVNSNTGTNTADYNTGGSQIIGTGAANTQTGITNMANFNSANLPAGNWLYGADPLIYGNGAASANTAELNQTQDKALYQTNDQTNSNALTFDASTGLNTEDYNTSLRSGVTQSFSGPSAATVVLSNQGNVNTSGYSTLGSITLPGGMQLNLGFSLGNLFHL